MDHRADIPLLTVLRDRTVCPKTFPKEKPSDPARPVQPVSNTSGALFTHSLTPSPPLSAILDLPVSVAGRVTDTKGT